MNRESSDGPKSVPPPAEVGGALLSAAQAARRAGVSRSLVYDWCRTKRLRHIRAGAASRRGKIVIREDDLSAFLKTLEVEAAPGPLASRHFG